MEKPDRQPLNQDLQSSNKQSSAHRHRHGQAKNILCSRSRSVECTPKILIFNVFYKHWLYFMMSASIWFFHYRQTGTSKILNKHMKMFANNFQQCRRILLKTTNTLLYIPFALQRRYMSAIIWCLPAAIKRNTCKKGRLLNLYIHTMV